MQTDIVNKKTNSVSVVLPSYNEKDNIVEAIERISAALGDDLHEIIIVDDNSPDGTWKIVQELKNPKVVLIRRLHEKGLASALSDGIISAQGSIVVWMDCDLGLPPEDIPRLVARIGKYDVAIGSRYVGRGRDLRPPIRAFLSTILNLYASVFLGFKVRDYTSGFIAVKKEVVEKVPISRIGFGEYFVKFCYETVRKGYKVTEVGYIYKDRTRGVSKSGGDLKTLLKYGWQYGVLVLKLRFR